MGADNWAICPKCRAVALAEKEKMSKEAEKAYGVVSCQEYQKRLDKANKEIIIEKHMREDYEIELDEYGLFKVDYRCHCSICNFKYEFIKTNEVKLF